VTLRVLQLSRVRVAGAAWALATALGFVAAPSAFNAETIEAAEAAPRRFPPTRPAPPAMMEPTALANAAPAPTTSELEAAAVPAPVVELTAAQPDQPPVAMAEPVDQPGPPPENWLDAQVELARRGFSSGSIDGVVGPKTRAALRGFQASRGLPESGELDEATRERLRLSAPAVEQRAIAAEDIAGLQPVSRTWLGKSQQSALAFETALEAVAERFHAHPALLRRLNPEVDWDALTAGTPVRVPAVGRVELGVRAARLQIRLGERVLQARDEAGRLVAHFPVSIGREAASRPVGELHVTVAIPDPNYTFDPEVFPESPEGRELGRKLILPPGPNNPVGVAWIGLDRPGYGIHGTPSPERIGSAESHGCFRLANWDARTLLGLAWVGLSVEVVP
jgi:lipoprotein-anchoring transpeptidase ErfK/SrfK